MSFGARLHKHRRDRRWPVPGCERRFAASLLGGCALLLWALLARPVHAQAGETAFSADAVKAVFLYRFAGYVQWPMSDAHSQFVVAVMGADDVVGRLQLLLPDHPIHGLPAQAHAIKRLQDLGDAQMLYIGPDFDGDLTELIARLRGRPVLVVTDRDGALDAGSMVNFLMQGGHVRFEVSLAAARQAGLTISSDLLAVAQRVKTGDSRAPPLCAPLQGRSTDCAHRVAAR
jgi:hypothetical protein